MTLGLYMDDGVDWWPLADVRKGDLKELQGLFDKGVLRIATQNTWPPMTPSNQGSSVRRL